MRQVRLLGQKLDQQMAQLLVPICCLILAIFPSTTTSLPTTSQRPPRCSGVTVSEYEVMEMLLKRKPASVIDFSLRPVRDATKPIRIGVRLVLSQINDVIEKDGIVRLSFYLSVTWRDEFLAFNNTLPFGCVDSIHLPAKKTWIPDVALINSRRHHEVILSDLGGRIRVHNSGRVSYRPGGTFDVFCKFNLRNFPFDQQTCALVFESWRYVTNLQEFYFTDPPISIRYWTENDMWALANFSHRQSTAKYQASDTSFDRLEFAFTLHRKFGFYLLNMIAPTVAISFAQISVFALALDDAMKMHISFTCLLAHVLFQLMIAADLPKFPDSMPVLILYLHSSTVYISLAILGEGFVFACLRKKNSEVPLWVLAFARFFSTLCCIHDSSCVSDFLLSDQESRSSSDEIPIMEHHFNTFPFDNHCHLSNTRMRSNLLFQAGDRKILGSAECVKAERSPSFLAAISAQQAVNNKGYRRSSIEDLQTKRRRWRLVASVIDRMTFLLYTFNTVMTPTLIFVIVPLLVHG